MALFRWDFGTNNYRLYMPQQFFLFCYIAEPQWHIDGYPQLDDNLHADVAT
jgi:hypothetical protein